MLSIVNQAGPLSEYYPGDVAEFEFQFFTQVQATVTAGGTSQSASGASETLTVSTVGAWPPVLAGQSIPVMDYAEIGTAYGYELLAATAIANGTGVTWTVTRGADGTPTTGHASPWTLVPVDVVSATDPPAVARVPADPTTVEIDWNVVGADGTTGSTTVYTYTGASSPAKGSVWRSGPGLYRTWIDLTGAVPGTLTVEAVSTGAAQKVQPRWATILARPI